MTDIGTFTEPKKMVALLPWEPWPSEFEVQKNDSLALIIETLHLKQNFFETDSCLLALTTTSTSQMQSCFKIDLGLIKLSNGLFLCLKARVFLMTIMKWRISGQGYKHLSRFSRFVFSEPTASTIQKINPVSCFNLCHWRFVHIHLFPVIWRKSSKSDFQSWRKNFSNDFALFCKMIA